MCSIIPFLYKSPLRVVWFNVAVGALRGF